MTQNFNELLNKPVTSAKRPPTKPAGTYHGIIGAFKFDVSKQQKTPFCRFTITNVSPGQDVIDQNATDDEGNPIDYAKWQPFKDYYLTHDALYRLREFLESCKLPIDGRSFAEVIPEVKGAPVTFSATQTHSTKEGSSDIFTNVDDLKGAA